MQYVTDRAGLDAAVAALRGASRLYLDTEFRSARGGHTLSLVQATTGDEVWVIDALAIRDLRPLAGALAGEGVTWVLHAGKQDVQLLCEALGLSAPPPLYDTQVAWALTGPEWGVSFAYLLFRVLGKRASKGSQQEDWIRRPLPESQLRYAADDVAPLPELVAGLDARLAAAGRAELVAAASREVNWPAPAPLPPLHLSNFRNAWQLDGVQLAALEFLIGWYNDLPAAERDDAPGRDGLFAIAGLLPESASAMKRIRSVPSRWAGKRGGRLAAELQAAIRSAKGRDAAPDPPPYATFASLQLDGWLRHACAEVAAAAAVAPDLVFPKPVSRVLRAALDDDADRAAAAECLTGWRAPWLADAWRAFCE